MLEPDSKGAGRRMNVNGVLRAGAAALYAALIGSPALARAQEALPLPSSVARRERRLSPAPRPRAGSRCRPSGRCGGDAPVLHRSVVEDPEALPEGIRHW